jgi:hypothetical protein
MNVAAKDEAGAGASSPTGGDGGAATALAGAEGGRAFGEGEMQTRGGAGTSPAAGTLAAGPAFSLGCNCGPFGVKSSIAYHPASARPKAPHRPVRALGLGGPDVAPRAEV